MPGNHDAYVRSALPAHAAQWGEFMRGDDATAPGLAFPFVRRRGPLALIGLTSAVPTAPFMATGRLGAEQIARLDALLPGLAGLFRVVLIHHPPGRSRSGRFKRLTDAAALRTVQHQLGAATLQHGTQRGRVVLIHHPPGSPRSGRFMAHRRKLRAVLARHGAELVLHGHDHVQALDWLPGLRGPIPALGVPSASATAVEGHHVEPAAYNLYRIDGSTGAWRCELVTRGFRAGADGIAELKRQELTGVIAG